MGNSANPNTKRVLHLNENKFGIGNYLMKRMARSLTPCIRWFIDQHSVHSANVGSNKAFDMVQNLMIKKL
jgi:ribosome-binding factor A